jgi:hypothetical protein
MNPSTRNYVLLTLNVVVWCTNWLIQSGSIALSAKPGIPVSIDVDPPRVRVSVDSQPWISRNSNNGWMNSPVVLNLPFGQHKIQFEREGYSTHTFKILIDEHKISPLKTAMERRESARHELEITGDGSDNENLVATLDKGLADGPLPMVIDDLLPGEHRLELKLTGLSGFRTKPTTCVFVIPENADATGTKISISMAGPKIKSSSNCRRVKEAH